MTRMFGMVLGCVIAAGLLAFGLRFVPDVEVATEEAGNAAKVLAEPAPVMPDPRTEEARGPEVDVLRVERDGAALVSGRGTPGAEVEILLGEQMAGSAPVDTQGNFVAFLTLPESDVPQSLNLRERDGSGSRPGSQSFVIETRRPVPVELAPTPRLESASTAGDLRAVGVEEEAVALVKAEVEAADETGMAQAPEPAATLVAEADPAASGGTATHGKAAAALVTAGTDGYSPGPTAPRGGLPAEPGPSVRIAARAETVPGPIDGPNPPRPGDIPAGPARGDTAPPTPAVQDVVRRQDPVPVPPSDAVIAVGTSVVPVVQAPSRIEAPRVLRVENGNLAVVQDSSTPRPELSIDTIRYAADGTVVLGGRAPEAASVRVYLDNRPLDAVRSEPDGQWRLDMPALAERTYTLRVDQLDAAGEVTARAETPFRPESAASLDALQGMVEDGVRRVTVQPGFTLWAIAESNYGDGLSFVRVFEANADKIGDPDLIYPGQIFAVPD